MKKSKTAFKSLWNSRRLDRRWWFRLEFKAVAPWRMTLCFRDSSWCEWTRRCRWGNGSCAPSAAKKMSPSCCSFADNASRTLLCSCSRNEDSQRLSRSFRNFILSQVNINRYMNDMSTSLRMKWTSRQPAFIYQTELGSRMFLINHEGLIQF